MKRPYVYLVIALLLGGAGVLFFSPQSPLHYTGPSGTTPSNGNNVCTSTTITGVSGSTSSSNCNSLTLSGSVIGPGGQVIYNSTTGQGGSIEKAISLTLSYSKQVSSLAFTMGVYARIGQTVIASNRTVVSMGANSPKGMPVMSLSILGSKLEQLGPSLIGAGATLAFFVNGTTAVGFSDGSVLSQKLNGSAGTVPLTYKAQGPSTSTGRSIDCYCNYDPSQSAYLVPNASGTLTLVVADQSDNPVSNAAGGSISGSTLCWDAASLTAACSITPPSFSGTLSPQSSFSLAVSAVTLGSSSDYYYDATTSSIICCKPQYAPVGYNVNIVFATPIVQTWLDASRQAGTSIQFTVATSPSSWTGGTVYLQLACTYFMNPKMCASS